MSLLFAFSYIIFKFHSLVFCNFFPFIQFISCFVYFFCPLSLFSMHSNLFIEVNEYILTATNYLKNHFCLSALRYTTVNFNNTLPLFGPSAWRWDDTMDQDNLLREPTRRVVQVADFGAGEDMNYTHPLFKMNPWFSTWLPDLSGSMDSLTKFTYYVGIKYSNQTGK